MIVTVTLNPAVDRTVEIGQLKRGGLNRITHTETDAGGKGINVSKTIQSLGGSSIAAGFIGGNTGRQIEENLRCMGIRTDFVQIGGESRVNTKVCEPGGIVTELNEPGPGVDKEQEELLIGKLEEYAAENVLFVLAGSLHRGASPDFYARVIRRLHAKGAKVLLDADREAFRLAAEEKPELIKPNRDEIIRYAGLEENASEEDIIEAAKKMIQKGIGLAAVSLGAGGAMFLNGDSLIRSPGLPVKALSTVGAGDAMAAALALSWEKGLCLAETAKLCIAVSAGAVTTAGTKPPSLEQVRELLRQMR